MAQRRSFSLGGFKNIFEAVCLKCFRGAISGLYKEPLLNFTGIEIQQQKNDKVGLFVHQSTKLIQKRKKY